MSDDLLLIADPDPQRRKALCELCAVIPIKTIDAPSLREARNILISKRISFCLIAAPLGDLYEFESFIQDSKAASIFIYGTAKRKLPGPVHLPDTGLATLSKHFKKIAAKQIEPIPSPQPLEVKQGRIDLILLGASTGGIAALETILRDFPEDCPPTLIVQHMRGGYAEGMVKRFDQLLRPSVVAAEDHQPIETGTIYVATDSTRHLSVVKKFGQLQQSLSQEAPVCGHCPSIDVLFRSASKLPPQLKLRAALLTGMGSDGAAGLALLKAAGAHTIAQDEKTSIVWGMPRAAIQIGAACNVLGIQQISAALLDPNVSSTSLRHSA